jgi:hypothetical protein
LLLLIAALVASLNGGWSWGEECLAVTALL